MSQFRIVKFRPKRDFVLMKPLERQDSQIIHVVTKQRMVRGEVKAVGPGRFEHEERDLHPRPLDVKVGDIINVGETPLKFPIYEENGVKYWIIQEQDIGFIET